MKTIFSMEDNAYQRWQYRLLRHTFRAVSQPGELIPLVHQPSHAYAGLHKTESLTEWAMREPNSDEPVLVIDSDVVFVTALDLAPAPGVALGMPYGYMDRAGKEDLIAAYCTAPDLFAPVGIPLLMQRRDLAAIGELWLQRTYDIMADSRWGPELGWITDMWAYCFAAADMGIRHETRRLCAFCDQYLDGAPTIHYTYDVPGWSKRGYTPGAHRIPSRDPHHAAGAMLNCLEAWQAKRGF